MGSFWNHRILATEHKGEIFFEVHEVYYGDKGVPLAYTENGKSVGGEDLDSIRWTLDQMQKCLDKPILWAGEKFPQEYK